MSMYTMYVAVVMTPFTPSSLTSRLWLPWRIRRSMRHASQLTNQVAPPPDATCNMGVHVSPDAMPWLCIPTSLSVTQLRSLDIWID